MELRAKSNISFLISSFATVGALGYLRHFQPHNIPPVFEPLLSPTGEWKIYLAVICLFWAGFFSAISFMESWVKFTAVTLPRETGLDVGRTVFWALNRVEIIFAIGVTICCGQLAYQLHTSLLAGLFGVDWLPLESKASLACVAILWVQVLVVQPYLDKRAIRTIQKDPTLPKRSFHSVYVILECVKLVLLLVPPYLILL